MAIPTDGTRIGEAADEIAGPPDVLESEQGGTRPGVHDTSRVQVVLDHELRISDVDTVLEKPFRMGRNGQIPPRAPRRPPAR